MTYNKEGPFRHLPGGESLPACWPECPACAYAAGRKSIEEEVDAKIRAGKYMSLFQYEEKLRNEGYAAGVKAERERITQKIIDMQFAFPGFANKTVDRIVESIRQEPA